MDATILLLYSLLSWGLAEDGCSFTSSSVSCVQQSGKFLPVETSSDISSLYIIRSDLSALTAEDFAIFESVYTLSIINSTLLFPKHDNLLSVIPELSVLRIINCNVSQDVSTIFAGNERITHLDLAQNKINALSKEFFAPIKNVEQINLSHNKITRIEVGTFDGLTSLRVLDLTDNNIGVSFDSTFLRLQSAVCVVCREQIGNKECSSDDFARCKSNEPEDQLWWTSVQVTIHLEENPICAIITGEVTNKNEIQSSQEVDVHDHHSCKVYDQGHCFKHESRRMFLLEACGITKMPRSGIAEKMTDDTVVQADKTVLWYSIPLLIIAVFIGAIITFFLVKKGIIAGKTASQELQLQTFNDVRIPLIGKEDTRLHQAIQHNNLAEVKRLLASGADPSAVDQHGDFPLHYAARLGYNDIIKALVKTKKVDINTQNSSGHSPIHSAIGRGHKETVDLLLKHSANINALNRSGNSPLSQACKEGHTNIVQLLLDKGAILDNRNTSGESPVHVAARSGRLDTLTFLIEKGADFRRSDNRGYTSLHYAARGGHFEIVKLLLDKGESVNVTNDSQNTPLHKAAKGGHLDIIKLLLERNADATATNYKGQKPRDVAAEQGHRPCERFLIFLTELAQESGDGSC